MRIDSPAKVNLTLEVLGRRPDGYHDICSVMHTISLGDRLCFEPADDLTLVCNWPELAGPDNLVLRAARLLRDETGIVAGSRIILEKRVPAAAGLGGGSSNAAATLRALDILWRLNLPRDRLMELAARLGSDVPFFLIDTGCALAEGRGERLTPLAPLPRRWLVLVKPSTGITAASVYRSFPRERWSDGSRTRRWLEQAAQGVVPEPFNDLETVALSVAPEAGAAREALLAAGARQAIMAGSGSTFFCLLESQSEATGIFNRLRAAGQNAYLATLSPPAWSRA